MDHEPTQPRTHYSSRHADRRAERVHETDADAAPESNPVDDLRTARRVTRQGRLTKLLFLALFPALLAWLAPAIIAHTSLRQTIVEKATGKLDGQVTLGGASFGWLSPVRLYDLQVTDRDGEPVASVAAISTHRTLFGLLMNQRNPGTIVLEKPVGRLVLRRDGSNLEDLLAPVLEEPSSGSEPTPVTLEVIDGEFELVDAETGRTWKLAGCNALVSLPGAKDPMEAELRGEISGDSGGGPIEVNAVWNPGEQLGSGKVAFKVDSLPLDLLDAPLQRFVGDAAAAGLLSVQGEYQCKADGRQHIVSIDNLEGRDLVARAAQWLGQDQVRIPALKASGAAAVGEREIQFAGVKLASDVATLDADGALSLDALRADGGLAKLLSMLQREDIEVRAELDLARLAALFPETLRVRPGTEITSGKLQATFSSRVERERRVWAGHLASTNLTALDQGRRISWDQPVELTLLASLGADGPIIEKLLCTSSFLQAEAQGTAADGRLTMEGDLDRLARELSQFLDLGGTRLAGKLNANVNWNVAERNRATAHGEVGLNQLEIIFGDARPWREPSLNVTFDAQASMNGAALGTLHSATLKVAAAEDTLDVELTEAVRGPSASTTWPLAARLQGDLQRWLPRVQTFLPLAGWDLAGQADIQLAGRFSPDRAEVAQGKLGFRDFTVVSGGLFVNEPQVQVELTGSWDRDTGRIESPTLTFASSAIAFRADQVAYEMSDRGGSLSANVGLRSDLARLTGWIQDPRLPVEWQLAGMSSGQVRLAHAGGATTAQWNLQFDNLAYAAVADSAASPGRVAAGAPALEPKWLEPKLVCTGDGTLDLAAQAFKINQSSVTGDGVEVALAGTVQEWNARCNVALEGQIGYDLARLVTRLRSHLGPSLQLDGRDVRPFAVRGPLRNLEVSSPAVRPASGGPSNVAATPWLPAQLGAQAGLRWNSATVYGLPIGPGELESTLKDGVLLFKPLDVEVAQGRLRLAPRVHFDQPEPVLVVEPGPALEKVTITPELCATWLKYVVPVVADVTEAQGQFSIALQDTAVVPLQRPEDGEVRGQIDIHGVQVGPSPMTRELISLAQSIKAIADNKPAAESSNAKVWLQMPEQPIPFQWRQRRVYHERLAIHVKDVSIVTGGSVGVDQTVSLMAQIPIRDEWVAKNRYLTSLQGQSLQFPITGTLSQPRVDRRVLQNLAAQTITNSANKVLEQELNKGLDRFLRPRTPQTPQQPAAPQPVAPQQP
ncbi:MAG: hypothetical protein U0939_10060 [Pirellulales bacterium]